MINNADFNLLMSQIYTDLIDKNVISLEQLSQYKNLFSNEQDAQGQIQEKMPYLFRLIGSYADKASQALPKETVLKYCLDILNSINSNLCSINVNFYMKKYEYILCDESTLVSDRISLLKECIAASDSEDIQTKIEFRVTLLDIYLSDPNQYLDGIRQLSSELKPLIDQRNASEH